MTKFEAIYDVIHNWDKIKKPLSTVLKSFFSEHTHFSHLEKQFIKKFVQHKIKHFIYLRFFDEYADKRRIFPLAFAGEMRDIFIIFVHSQAHIEADELVTAHLPEFTNQAGDLFLKVKLHFRKFEEDIIRRSPIKKQLYVLHSFSREIVDLWLDQYSEQYAGSLMKAFNGESPFSLRINQHLTNRKDLRHQLEENGIFTYSSEYSSRFLNVRNPEQFEIDKQKQLHKGLFIVQDEGEYLLNQIHNPVPRDLILDLNPTNGPFLISYALDAHPRTRIHAICHSNGEVRNMIDKVKPFSLSHLEIKNISNQMELNHIYENKADVVFVRPDTAGFGKAKSEPDRKWNISKNNLYKLYDRQNQLLATAEKLVKPGGKMIYISDSFNQFENEKLISNFLMHHSHYHQVKKFNLQPKQMEKAVTSDHFIQYHPKDFSFNSYFAAVLKRRI